MQNNNTNVLPIEKVISLLSYMSMGIIGLVWYIIALLLKRKLKYFLLYNISQSMIIAIILAIFKLFIDIILMLISKIPFLDFIVALFNLIISIKIIRFHTLGFSFTLIEFLVFLLLLYISIGVILGKIFYIPFLTKFMNKVIKQEK